MFSRDIWQVVGGFLEEEELVHMFDDWTENEEAALGFVHSIPGLTSRFQIVRHYMESKLNLPQMDRINFCLWCMRKHPLRKCDLACFVIYHLKYEYGTDAIFGELVFTKNHMKAIASWKRVWPRFKNRNDIRIPKYFNDIYRTMCELGLEYNRWIF